MNYTKISEQYEDGCPQEFYLVQGLACIAHVEVHWLMSFLACRVHLCLLTWEFFSHLLVKPSPNAIPIEIQDLVNVTALLHNFSEFMELIRNDDDDS